MSDSSSDSVAVIGGGPAGLMAAEVLAEAGVSVDIFEAKPSLGRKFLRAGIGGLNLTHGEPFADFCRRFGDRQERLQPALDHFPPTAVRQWAAGLGVETFVGTSGRVFPQDMKAAPLLRAWVQRLRNRGVRFHMRHRWSGWTDDGGLRMDSPAGERILKPRATVLALGGGSWPQLGSDGAWVSWLEAKGVPVVPLQSANCGFEIAWTPYLRERFAGAEVKPVALTFTDIHGLTETRRGELIVSEYGVEGSLVYAFSRRLREAIQATGSATFTLDLAPDRGAERLRAEVARPRGARSLSSHLKGRAGITGVKSALLHEVLDKAMLADPLLLVEKLKALPLTVTSARPLAEAISTAGGVSFDGVDERLMLKSMPGVFVAGEMLDWEAPTGGYLLTACLAQGRWAGENARDFLFR